MISITALIYRSTAMADLFYTQLMKHTPMLHDGSARFFFVANDATDEVKAHLLAKGYPHIIHENKRLSDGELFAMGIGKPEYIHRVYCGWNRAIEEGDEWVCLLNSDNFVSPGWLEGLWQHADTDRFICSGLVERKHPRFNVFPGAHHAECGTCVDDYDEDKFTFVASNIKRARAGQMMEGGAYMPCLFKRSRAMAVGMYPEGNLAGGSFDHVREYGDAAFVGRLEHEGVKHLTTWDSVVYHLKEGEDDA